MSHETEGEAWWAAVHGVGYSVWGCERVRHNLATIPYLMSQMPSFPLVYLANSCSFFLFLIYFIFLSFYIKLLIFFLIVYLFLVTLHSMWDLSSPARDQTHVPCMEAQSLNRWTATKVPCSFFLKVSFFLSLRSLSYFAKHN